jgi:hypothetical protein
MAVQAEQAHGQAVPDPDRPVKVTVRSKDFSSTAASRFELSGTL